MGFVSTDDVLQLTAYLTQRGRELLLNGVESDITAKYFSLGDSDTNYKVFFNLSQGYVPDLTGDNTDCVMSLANNIQIKYPVSYNTVVVEPPKLKEVRLQRTDNGEYQNVLDCLIHLDKIARYQLFHSAGNKSNPNRLKVNNVLKSPLPELFKQVSVLNNPSNTPSNADFDPNADMVFELLFDSSVYKKLVNGYLADNKDNTVNTSSPIALTFSSLQIGDNVYKGSGRGSVGLYSREIGYVYRNDNSNYWQFFPAAQVEGVKNYTFYTDANNSILNRYTGYALAAKVNAKDESTGQIKPFFYRGDKNLSNVSDTTLSSFDNETKFSNQYAKLFADDNAIVDGYESTTTVSGLMQKEVSNLKDFVQTSGLFNKIDGTNEYRTTKLSFSVYTKASLSGVTPATLNLIFKFDEDEMLNGDNDYSSISDEGDAQFVQYEFVSTNGIFKSKAKTGKFVRNNCGTNSSGSEVTYTVPAGKYTGATQSAADTLAQNDVNNNGQAFANDPANGGTCTATVFYQSAPFSQYVQRNDCGANATGENVYITYPAGQFSSNISAADANSQASIAAQQRANILGTCTYYSTGSSGDGGCLLAGQKVLTSKGYVNIENLAVGDKVYTLHEITQTVGEYQVEDTFKGIVDRWYNIETIDGRVVKCSPTHLFMVNDAEVKRAYELTSDDKILVHNVDGTLSGVSISTIMINVETVEIFNIEVEDAHTYITENGVWHHNKIISQQPVGTINVE